MKELRARMLIRAKEEKRKELYDIACEKRDINIGSQIRSYILQPYHMVKDHRTEQDYSRVDAILDGDLDELIESYLKSSSMQASRIDG